MAKEKAKSKEEAPAKGTGTGTGTETKTKTKEKVEVTVHPGLLELFKKHDASLGEAASFLVEIGETVMRDNVSNPVLIKTIIEARGITPESAKSQASRLRSLLKHKEGFEALKRGEVTVRAAVKSAQAARVPSKITVSKKFDMALNKFVEAAKAVGQDRKTIMATVEAAMDKAQIK